MFKAFINQNLIEVSNMEDKITIAVESLSGYGMSINDYPITKETEKSYIIMINKNRHIISKEKIGKAIHYMSDYCPSVKVFLYNASKLEAKEKLAEWFENEAKCIRR